MLSQQEKYELAGFSDLNNDELQDINGGLVPAFLPYIGPICGLIAVARWGFELGRELAQ